MGLTIKSLHHFNPVLKVVIIHCKWKFLVDATQLQFRCGDKHVSDEFVDQFQFDFTTIRCGLNILDAKEAV